MPQCSRTMRKSSAGTSTWGVRTAASSLARNTAVAYRALLLRHLAAVDLDEVNGRHVLRALLAGGTLLDEGDVAVDALHLDAPERRGDGLGIGLAGGLTEGFRGWDGIHVIVEGIKAAGKAEPEAITKALWGVKVKGINGDIAFIKQGPEGKESAQNVPSVYLVKIDGGKVTRQ